VAEAPPPPDPAANLSMVVARLADQGQRSALDWAELGRETVTWGQHLQSASQPVAEGPVRDALQAVDQGEAADPKASDWHQLRAELQELLPQPTPTPTPSPDQKNQQKQNQDQKNQNQDQKQNQKEDQKSGSNSSDTKDQSGQEQPKPDQQNQPQPKDSNSKGQPDQGGKDQPNPNSKPQDAQKQDRAFGNMHQPTPTPASAHRPGAQATQKVGGAKEAAPDAARNDPQLAIPLEKLEQLKDSDQPAELAEMLRRGEAVPTPPPNSKNW